MYKDWQKQGDINRPDNFNMVLQKATIPNKMVSAYIFVGGSNGRKDRLFSAKRKAISP